MNFNQLLIVSVSIGQWDGRLSDKEVNKKIRQEYEAEEGAGNYTKYLLARAAIHTYSKLTTEIRDWILENTMTYDRDGQRVVSVAHFETTLKWELEARQERWWSAVNEFLARYNEFKEDRKRLGKMYKEKDYPTVEKLREKFSFKVSYKPLPQSQHIVAELESEMSKELKEKLDYENEVLKNAMYKDLWDRLHNAVSHMVERLSGADKKFHDTLIGNLVELCDILKTLNPNGEGELEAIRQKVEARLVGFSPRLLRQDNKAREEAHVAAAVILGELEAGRRKLKI